MICFLKTFFKKAEPIKAETKVTPKVKDAFKRYCEENPWAVECRIYDV